MSTELQLPSQHLQSSHLETEIVSAEMITEAVNACFSMKGDDVPDRALELITPEEIAACDTDMGDDADDAREVETAEELSLKNGVYHEIRRKLHERYGIPPTEVAFIHDADTPARKAKGYVVSELSLRNGVRKIEYRVREDKTAKLICACAGFKG